MVSGDGVGQRVFTHGFFDEYLSSVSASSDHKYQWVAMVCLNLSNR